MSRMVVVGRVGVEGPFKPMLSRALGGAGMPGRRIVPGSGTSVFPPIDMRVSLVSVKWSVWGKDVDSGREE